LINIHLKRKSLKIGEYESGWKGWRKAIIRIAVYEMVELGKDSKNCN